MNDLVATAFAVLRQSAEAFQRDRARRLSAGLAYYSLFALVPTVLLAASITAAFFGKEATEGRIVEEIEDVVGTDLATVIEDALAGLWDTANASAFTIVSIGVVIYSASILFVAWRDTLELVWDVPYRPGLETTIRSRVFGALAPIGAGVLLAAIVLVEMLVALAQQLINSAALDAAFRAAGTIFPSAAGVVALAVVYRLTTRIRPDWSDIWPGTLLAAVSLALLSWGYGLYIRFFGSASVAGAAGSVVLGLAFVYYSAQILLFGAHVIQVRAERNGRPIGEALDS